ncbi:hypothetical protein DXG01_004187 [Tephrocybe rancida]|nr:hypothetical protein DXG01_004187 [Tephrocybe rancida]
MFFPFTHRHHSKVPPLLQEILEHIIGHCTPKDLRACSLASSSLRFPAQRALFHEITILLFNTHARFTSVDIFLASNARIASYICHLTLVLSSSSLPPQSLPHLKGLKALCLHAHELHHVDWRVFPVPLTDALSTSMQTPGMESLELRNIAHFPLAVALPLRHFIIFGRGPFDTTTLVPDERLSQLQSLRVAFHYVLKTLVDLSFLDLSRLVRFDTGVNDPASIAIIQRILDGCAPTLQDPCLRAYSSDFESHDSLFLSHLTSLTSLFLPLTSPASLKWCTHTLLTLPSSLSMLTLILHTFGPIPTKHFPIDCIALYTQLDALPIRKLYIDRQRSLQGLYVKELEDDDELTLEELLPRLAMRRALVGPPPVEVRKPESGLLTLLLYITVTSERYNPLDVFLTSLASFLLALAQRLLYYSPTILLYTASECYNTLDPFLTSHQIADDYRRQFIVAIRRLSATSGLYPACYELKDAAQDSQGPVASGGFADIYKGSFGGQVQFWKEILLWGQLTHTNVLPIDALYRFKERLCIVALWMHNGDITTYLETNPTADRRSQTLDVANGLQYLHQNSIIHGDFKGVRGLAGEHASATLGFLPSATRRSRRGPQSFVGSKGGSTRWQAPELLDLEGDEEIQNTFSDVYALAVCYEIFTGKIAFDQIFRDATIALQVKAHITPLRQDEPGVPWQEWGLTESIWRLMEGCWKAAPEERPTVQVDGATCARK